MDKTILITGATSGLGEAAARRFAGAGWKVVITRRRANRLDRLAAEFGVDRVHAVTFDISDEAGLDAVLEALPESFHGIDVLVTMPAWHSAPGRQWAPIWMTGAR